MNLIDLYLNYLHALEVRRLYGTKYGDTDEIIKMYEEQLQQKSLKLIKKE